ncbi:MAG: hypothetical protein ABR925_06090 [Acidimicrobiales bacterium]
MEFSSAATKMTTWRQGAGRSKLLGRLAGSGLLLASGAIHLDLYLTGYRSIPTIGWLFLLQFTAAFGLAALIAATSSRLASGAGAVFAISTLGGYLLSMRVGLFAFKEVRTPAGVVAGAIEVAAFAVLALVVVSTRNKLDATRGSQPRQHGESLSIASKRLYAAVAVASVLAAALLGVAVATGREAATSTLGRTEVMVRLVGGRLVLTNAKGFTLYWFAPDGPSDSRCYGSCALYWPPVIGVLTAGRGVNGRLGHFRRASGSIQATYDGHPLYTYIGDSAPGQAHGNGLNLNGGLWHEVTASPGGS